MRSLTRVEAIPCACMEAELPWTWETFPEWMDALDRAAQGRQRPDLCAGQPVAGLRDGLRGGQEPGRHRRRAGRDGAAPRRGDRGRRLRLVGAAARRPASGLDLQRDYDGTPFATDLMSNETALALGKALGRLRPHASSRRCSPAATRRAMTAHLEELADGVRQPAHLQRGRHRRRMPDAHRHQLAWIRSCQERGSQDLRPVRDRAARASRSRSRTGTCSTTRRPGATPPSGRRPSGWPSSADPARRAGAQSATAGSSSSIGATVILRTYSERFLPAKGTLLPDAARILGYDDLADLLIDMIVADELKRCFQPPQVNEDPALQAELVVAPYGLWGVSDGGAHTKFLTIGAYPTESIIDFVRERHLSRWRRPTGGSPAFPAHCAGFQRPRHPRRRRAGRHHRLRLREPEPARRGGRRRPARRRVAPHPPGRGLPLHPRQRRGHLHRRQAHREDTRTAPPQRRRIGHENDDRRQQRSDFGFSAGIGARASGVGPRADLGGDRGGRACPGALRLDAMDRFE